MAFSTILKRYRAAKDLRLYMERNWLLNLAFYLNEQWVGYDSSAGRLRLMFPQSKKKPRLSSNIIRPRVLLNYANVATSGLRYNVKTDPTALNTADRERLVQSYLDYLWKYYDYEKTLREALLWACICGTGFVKWYYDPSAGPVYNLAGEMVSAGDPVLDVVSPFELCLDPHARTTDELSWVVHERVRSKDYVREKYGKDVPGTFSGDSLASMVGSLRSRAVQHRVPSVLLCEYWERPTVSNPKGYYVVFSGSTVLYEGDNPYYDVSPIPFAAMRYLPLPGEVWGDSSVTDMRQINVIYNKLRCDVLENTSKLSNPPMIAPAGSFWQEPGWEPAEIAYYNPLNTVGGKIEQIKIEPFPAPIVNMLLRLEQEADEHAGVSQLTRGQMPRGARSAAQLSSLYGAEAVRRFNIQSEYINAAESALNGALALGSKFCTLPRFLTVVGGEKDAYVIFKGSDIPANIRVQVSIDERPDPGEAERRSELLFALYDRGIIQDPRLLLSLQERGSLEEAVTDLELDSSQAKRENERLMRGEKVQVEEWHNHAVHMLEHNRVRKTEKYEALDTITKRRFAEHVEQHKAMAAQMAQMAQAAQNNAPERRRANA